MKILFIHPSFPAQYKHLIKHFAASAEHQVLYISKKHQNPVPEGVINVIYEVPRDASPVTHRYLIGAEKAVLQGQEVWRICRQLKETEGFTPDIICTHPGWGDGLFLKDIYPEVPILSYFEFFYRFHGADVNFDPETPSGLDDGARVRIKNTTNLHNLEMSDWGISPTHWQKSLHPEAYQNKISVIHEGIDTDKVKPDDSVSITLKEGVTLKKGDPIITYVTRNFEHYRGSHQFLRAVKHIQEMHPTAMVVAVGADEISYGRAAPDGKRYRHILLDEVKPDMSRLFFTGAIPYEGFLKVLQISAAHVYLTVPFVLSWSMLEAMAAECLVIGSSTAPVQEVIKEGENGMLADFFSPKEIAEKAVDVLNNPEKYAPMRKAARQTILDHYDIKKLLPKQIRLIEQIAARQLPPKVHKTLDAPISQETLFKKVG
ncbi:MAG: glycosyltransferase family 4 protein [Rickettsiales bacterium]|nr:glycosyltransferase family 4 protein [Rickettsiales bacterium]